MPWRSFALKANLEGVDPDFEWSSTTGDPSDLFETLSRAAASLRFNTWSTRRNESQFNRTFDSGYGTATMAVKILWQMVSGLSLGDGSRTIRNMCRAKYDH